MTQHEHLKVIRVASKGIKDSKSSLNIAGSTIITSDGGCNDPGGNKKYPTTVIKQ